jgi:hypothetical protein
MNSTAGPYVSANHAFIINRLTAAPFGEPPVRKRLKWAAPEH